MFNNSSIRRIIISTIAFLITLLLCIFPANRSINVPGEVIYIKTPSIPIYTLFQNNYVARTQIVKNEKDIIPYIIKALTIDLNEHEYLPNGFLGIIPKDTKLLSYTNENGLVKLDFSKHLLNVNKENEEKLIESLIYSLCELDNVKQIMIFIEGKQMTHLPHSQKKLPPILDKKFGINKIYELEDIKNTTMTTIYYGSKYENELYYIPISRITNEQIEPVEIIIKELKTTPVHETNLISYLNASYEIKDYEILENKISLSFDNKILAGLNNNGIDEKVKYAVSLSIRDTYNINNITINAS